MSNQQRPLNAGDIVVYKTEHKRIEQYVSYAAYTVVSVYEEKYLNYVCLKRIHATGAALKGMLQSNSTREEWVLADADFILRLEDADG